MKSESLLYWFALQRASYNAPIVAKKLLDFYGQPEEVFKAVKALKEENAVIEKLKKFNDWKICEKDIAECKKNAVSIITLHDENYPVLLKEIPDPPIVLMIKGKVSFQNPAISMVGARKATSHGRDVAFEMARNLASFGITIVSGMAYGIDEASHYGAMTKGMTIAVLGCGIDWNYPKGLTKLRREIETRGCLLSEFPLGTPPDLWNFPQRNRIISGLSFGTIVVEAAEKSGSLITARLANEQGRDVFAMPGPAGTMMSQGTHGLLRSGAIFAENHQDILDVIKNKLPTESQTTENSRLFSSDGHNEHPLFKYITDKAKQLDDIIVESSFETSYVVSELTRLCVEGLVEEEAGKLFRRKDVIN